MNEQSDPAEFSTERPTPLAMFARPERFFDRPPAPQVLAFARPSRSRFAAYLDSRLTRRRPRLGAFTILDLRADSCRFIAGDDGLHCGDTVVPGCKWCGNHARVVYRGRPGC
jgi:hypothetical protein